MGKYNDGMKPVQSVDEYIAAAPAETRERLKALREAIRAAAPYSEERISYGMPYYGYKGRLAYFSLSKNHIGLYVPPPVIAEHRRELRGYVTAKATVRFPLNKRLPLPLVRKLVKARVKKNDEANMKATAG